MACRARRAGRSRRRISYFDYLADGETVTLTYTVEVDDHHGGVTSQDVVVTVNGSNDAPEIANIAQQGLTEQTDTAPLTTTIPVTFTDLDLSDVGHSATIAHAVATGATTGLALDEAALIALVTPGVVTKAAGSTAGRSTCRSPRPRPRSIIWRRAKS